MNNKKVNKILFGNPNYGVTEENKMDLFSLLIALDEFKPKGYEELSLGEKFDQFDETYEFNGDRYEILEALKQEGYVSMEEDEYSDIDILEITEYGREMFLKEINKAIEDISNPKADFFKSLIGGLSEKIKKIIEYLNQETVKKELLDDVVDNLPFPLNMLIKHLIKIN
mgnify:CR=1 FL=1